jgi:hypothetical protein
VKGWIAGVAPIALSVAARAVLFLGLSWYVYAAAAPAAAAGFFQDLFLQSVMITFLSASSFFAMVSKSWDAAKDRLLLLSHGIMAVGAVAVVVLCSRFGTFGAQADVLYLLLAGAVATGLASPLTGLIMRKRGAWLAYGPSIIAAPLFLGTLLISVSDAVLAGILAIVGFQITVLLALAVIARHMLIDALRAIPDMMTGPALRALWATFVFGALNTALVGYVYWFREAWVLLQVAEISAAVLFVARISDTAVGIIMTDIGARVHAVNLVEQRVKWLPAVVIALGLSGGALLLALNAVTLSPTVFAITGQVVLECVRLPLIVFFLYQSARRSAGGYISYTLGTVMISMAVMLIVPLQDSATGFYLFQTLTTVLSALITCAFALRFPSKGQGSSG